MPTKKIAGGRQTSVRAGNVTDISGNVNIAGGNISTHTNTGLSANELVQLFDRLYSVIESREGIPATDKGDLKAEVNEIQSTVMEAVQKNGKVEEGFLSRRFRNIARIAPDILDVVVATLANPLAGLGILAGKIAEKAKKEAI